METSGIIPRTPKLFHMTGIVVDHETAIAKRLDWEHYLETDMRDKGYVRVLDIVPELYISYNEDEENFKFAIVMYGIYVGKKKSKEILGFLGNHKFMKEPFRG